MHQMLMFLFYFDEQLCLQVAGSFAPIKVSSDPLSQYRCVASDSFFGRSRYDYVQIAWEGTQQKYAWLCRIFRYLPIGAGGAPISIVYVQVFKTISTSHVLFGTPVVRLEGGHMEIMCIDVIDHRVLVCPDFSIAGQFFVHE